MPPSPHLTYQPACKPGSVRPAGLTANVTAIPLVRRLPSASSNLPERLARTDPRLAPQRRSYSVLLPVGFAVPLPSPETRCALTAPFHPCLGPYATQPRRSVLCGTVPEVSPARVQLRRTLSGTVRPWSPDFPPRPPFGIGAERPSGRLTRYTWPRAALWSTVRAARRLTLCAGSRDSRARRVAGIVSASALAET